MDTRDASLVIRERIEEGHRRKRILVVSIFILVAVLIVAVYLSYLFFF